MLLVRQRRIRVRNHEDLVVEHHRVARSRFATDIRQGAGDQEGIDTAGFELPIDVRGAADEGAVLDLLDP